MMREAQSTGFASRQQASSTLSAKHALSISLDNQATTQTGGSSLPPQFSTSADYDVVQKGKAQFKNDLRDKVNRTGEFDGIGRKFAA